MFTNEMMYGKNIVVEELYLLQTGTYDDQYHHDYTINTSGNQGAMMQASERLHEATHAGNNLTPAAIANANCNVIAPRADVGSSDFIVMPYGWNQERFLFMMRVRVTQHMSNMDTVYYVTGYTDSNDVTVSGAIAPDLKFFINNSIRVVETHNLINGADTVIQQPRQFAQYLIGRHQAGINQSGPTGINDYQMLPSTIAEMAGSVAISQMQPSYQVQASQQMAYQPPLLDSTAMFHEGGIIQTRDNNIPSRWLSRFFNGYSNAMANQYNDESNTMFYRQMAASIPEPLFNNDEVLSLLRRSSRLGECNGGYVTWYELQMVSPYIDSVTKVNRVSGNNLGSLNQAGSGEQWSSATCNKWAAAIISHVVPSLMAPLMLTRITFTLTNMVVGGGWQYQLHSNSNPNEPYLFTPKSFMSNNVDISAYLAAFERQIRCELIPALQYNPDWPIHVTVDAQLLRDIVINLSVAGEPSARFVFPTFADHRMAPVITTNYSSVQNMSTDLVVLANQFIEVNQVVNSMPIMGGNSGNNFGSV